MKHSGGICCIFLLQDPNIPFKTSKNFNCWAFLPRLFAWSHLARCTSTAGQQYHDLPSLCGESLQIHSWCSQEHCEERTDPTKESRTLLRGSVQTQHLSCQHPKLWRRHWRGNPCSSRPSWSQPADSQFPRSTLVCLSAAQPSSQHRTHSFSVNHTRQNKQTKKQHTKPRNNWSSAIPDTIHPGFQLLSPTGRWNYKIFAIYSSHGNCTLI